MKQYISVDLGGTRIRAARFDEALNLLERQETLTLAQEGFEPVMGRIKALIKTVLPANRDETAGIGICVPGPVNPITDMLADAANLPGWQNVPVSQILRDEFGVPAFTGNDANVAALAELHDGAARGYRNIIYLTISTGIGGGLITDGKLMVGQKGLAGEVGHMHIVVNGQAEEWEHLAAGPGMVKQVRRRLESGEASVIGDWIAGDMGKVSGHMISEAAQKGDALAQDVIQYTAQILGIGISNLILIFNPEIIVLGGGVSNIGEGFFEQIRSAVRQYTIPAFMDNLKIVPAALQDNAGLIGAAALVREGVQTA